MKKLMLTLAFSFSPIIGLFNFSPVLADQSGLIAKPVCQTNNNLPGCASGKRLDASNGKDNSYLNTFVNALIYAAGVVSSVFILVGAAKYITSSGDPSRIKSAKDTLLYAITGLIVVILAREIITFVLEKV